MDRKKRVVWGLFAGIFSLAVGLVVYDLYSSDQKMSKTVSKKVANESSCLLGQGEQKAVKGYCAPNFILKNFAGEDVELYKNDDKPTLLSFWTSWCGACNKGMPDIAEMYEKYKDKINFRLVNMTGSENQPSDGRRYVDEKKYKMPFLVDSDNKVSKELYRVTGIPAHFFINKKGQIMNIYPGKPDKEKLESMLEELVQ